MKKFFIFVMMCAIAFTAFATPITIRVLHSGDTVLGNTTMFTVAANMLAKDYPDVKIEFYKIDLSTGSSITMDAMLAANDAPNVYVDTMVRASKYMVPGFALPLDSLVRDLSKYNTGILDPYKKGGRLLALPQPGGAQGMCVNLDMMKEIGFVVKSDWTIDDFLAMARLVRDKYKGERWATGMFAANQSGDYLLHNWFPAFGAEYYKNGNYDKSTIADTGGAKTYAFYQTMVKEGFVPPNSASLNDDDLAAMWAEGKFAATGFFPAWAPVYFDTAMKQGTIKKPFEYAFVPFPRAKDVARVATYISNGAIVVIDSKDTAKNAVAARFAEYANSATVQALMTATVGWVPNRGDVKATFTDVHIAQTLAIVQSNGVYDCGLTDSRFTERRALQFPILQQVLNLKITPEAAIKQYQDALSAVK